jgi:hypothetical protein
MIITLLAIKAQTINLNMNYNLLCFWMWDGMGEREILDGRK